jgi:DNA-binding protein HU-beta
LEVNTMVGLPDVVSRVARESGLTQTQARKAIDAFLNAISTSLADGEEVRLTGFGTFRVRETAERMGRNPRTGEPTRIAAARRPAFSPGARLTEQVRGDGRSA